MSHLSSGPDRSVSLEIDGILQDHPCALVHSQDDPFPGGHDYLLRIHEPKFVKLLRKNAPPGPGPLSTRESRDVLRSLSMYLDEARGDEATRYVLNTASYIEFSESCVVLHGICSELLPAQRGASTE